MFVTLQKDDQLPYTVHADYIKSIQRYQIDFDLRYLIKEMINGDYKMVVHIDDPRALKPFKFDLGVLYVNFNEGTNEATNDRVREDYKLLDKITNYFPPEEPPKGAAIPLVFTIMMVALFLYYVGEIYGNSGNLKLLSFWGFIFTLNYIGILAIIVAFWVKINLVNTLWILLAVAPVTLFTMNKGLNPENCHVSGFQKPSKNKQN